MITEEWLKENGFKWHDVERSGKHWLLWIGSAIAKNRSHSRTSSYDDFGIELSKFIDKESEHIHVFTTIHPRSGEVSQLIPECKADG